MLALDGTARTSLVVGQAFPSLPDDELPDVIARARELHGFDVFEVVAPERGANLRKATDAASGATLILLAGLPLLRAGATLIGEARERAEGVAIVRTILAKASDVGAEAVMVTSGSPDGTTPFEVLKARLVESLSELGIFAAACGVRLRLEPTDVDLQHRQFVGPTRLAIDIVAEVAERGSGLDLNLDLSHLLQLGEDPRESMTLARAVCRHFHLANAATAASHPLRGDSHPPFGHPGTEVGAAELASALRDLRETGYLDGSPSAVIGLEVVPLAGDDRWETLATAVTTWDEAVRASR